MKPPNGARPAKPGYMVIFRKTVRHWRSGKLMTRKDGKPFVLYIKVA